MKSEKSMSMKDRIKARAKRREGQSRGTSMFKLPDDTEFLELEKRMSLDILPYRVSVDNNPEAKEGQLWYERTFLIHRNIGPDQQTVVCPRTFGKKCPICEDWNKMRRDSDADEDLVKALKPSERQAFNVRDANKPDDGVKLFTISTAMFGNVLEEAIRDGDDDVAGFSDLKGGKTIAAKFKAKKIGKSEFWECVDIEFEDRDDLDEDILDETVDLDTIFNVMSYADLEKLYKQTEDGEDDDDSSASDDDDSDDEPPKKKVKKPAKDDDDDADDTSDDSSGDDDDDADEPPKKSKKVKDDDDDDADTDDDEPPKKKAKKPSSDDDDDDDASDKDDDDDDADSSDDDDDDDLPKKKAKKPVKDDDDDDADVDDDDDDRPPRRKK